MIQFSLAEAAFALMLVAFKYLTLLFCVCIVLWLVAQGGGRGVVASRIAVAVTGTLWTVSLAFNICAVLTASAGDLRGEVMPHAMAIDGYSFGAGDTVFRGDNRRLVRVRLAEPRNLAGIKASGVVEFDGEGNVTRAHLSENQEIETVPCAGDADARFSAGQLERCVLARAYSLDGVLLPAGTDLCRFPGLWHAFLPDDLGTAVGAIVVPGGADVRFDQVRRHAVRLNVREDRWVMIGGLRLTGTIDFAEDGRLETADVFDAVDLDGQHHPAGTFVRFTW